MYAFFQEVIGALQSKVMAQQRFAEATVQFLEQDLDQTKRDHQNATSTLGSQKTPPHFFSAAGKCSLAAMLHTPCDWQNVHVLCFHTLFDRWMNVNSSGHVVRKTA